MAKHQMEEVVLETFGAENCINSYCDTSLGICNVEEYLTSGNVGDLCNTDSDCNNNGVCLSTDQIQFSQCVADSSVTGLGNANGQQCYNSSSCTSSNCKSTGEEFSQCAASGI